MLLETSLNSLCYSNSLYDADNNNNNDGGPQPQHVYKKIMNILDWSKYERIRNDFYSNYFNYYQSIISRRLKADRNWNKTTSSHKNSYNMKLSQILFIISILFLLLLQTSQQFTLISNANQNNNNDGLKMSNSYEPQHQHQYQNQPSNSNSNSNSITPYFASSRYIYPNIRQDINQRRKHLSIDIDNSFAHQQTKNDTTKQQLIIPSKRDYYPSTVTSTVTNPFIPNSLLTDDPTTMLNDSQLNAYKYELTVTSPRPSSKESSNLISTTTTEYQLDLDNNKNDRLSFIQNQIVELKLQLERELIKLDLISKEKIKIGSPCLKSTDCSSKIIRSHCKLDNFTCSCLPQHVEYNSTTCLAPSLLGYECLVDTQCTQKVSNSRCHLGSCICLDNFVPYRKDKCLPGSEINNYCLNDRQCQLLDRHSHCKWKIQNIYGLCKCPPNYLPIKTSKTMKCAPRLGDLCFDTQECQLTTNNSICKEINNDLKAINKWQSSFDKNLTSRCQCQDNFKESKNKLECEQIKSIETSLIIFNNSFDTKAKNISQINNKHAFDLLERGQLKEYQKFMDSVLITGRKQQPINLPANLTTNRKSSLGKSCSSSLECKLKDKFSDCINGICECLKPTLKCSSNSTGCHKDTFQCRSGQCISWYFVCDNFNNCQDGSDEENCKKNNFNKTCPVESFQCKNGACLGRGKLCNGVEDCSDGSDEFDCGSFNKTNSVKQTKTKACHPQAFSCDNGQCLPGYVFCNAIEECADGSDENKLFCQRTTTIENLNKLANLNDSTIQSYLNSNSNSNSNSNLKDSLVIKTDRAVINELLLKRRQQLDENRIGLPLNMKIELNNKQQIIRSTKRQRQAKLDQQFFEQQTETTTTTTTSKDVSRTHKNNDNNFGECPNWAFTCNNGHCRSSAILCSGVDGCGDNSDEDKCHVCQCEAP